MASRVSPIIPDRLTSCLAPVRAGPSLSELTNSSAFKMLKNVRKFSQNPTTKSIKSFLTSFSLFKPEKSLILRLEFNSKRQGVLEFQL